MTRKTRLIVAGVFLAVLAAALVYVYLPAGSSRTDAEDLKRLETLREDAQAQAAKPPPVKFEDLPAAAPTGRREQAK